MIHLTLRICHVDDVGKGEDQVKKNFRIFTTIVKSLGYKEIRNAKGPFHQKEPVVLFETER